MAVFNEAQLEQVFFDIFKVEGYDHTKGSVSRYASLERDNINKTLNHKSYCSSY